MLAQLPIVPKKTGEVLQAGTRDDAMIALLKGQCGKGRGYWVTFLITKEWPLFVKLNFTDFRKTL